MRLVLMGVDPGIVDTASVEIFLDLDNKQWGLSSTVWHDVTSRNPDNNREIVVSPSFTADLKADMHRVKNRFPSSLIGVEGYRQRGKNTLQDQNMLALVQHVNKQHSACRIVDNTGIRQVVTDDTLKLFQCWTFAQKTNHQDLRSAARVALKRGIADELTNDVLTEFVLDHLVRGMPWSLGSIPIR